MTDIKTLHMTRYIFKVQQLAQSNPQLGALISQNPQRFIQAIMGGAGGGGAGGGGGGMPSGGPPPGAIAVTSEEKNQIDGLAAMLGVASRHAMRSASWPL